MLVIKGRPRDLGGGFVVSRVLPQSERRMVGPFVFFDYFGPVDLAPGHGIDVRPHPHLGLATVTYLFEGGQVHRDSLGSVQAIEPGDVNWMTAGRGIVHSERTGPQMRAAGHRMHGIQSWVGLPQADEDCAPSFQHVARGELPTWSKENVALRLVAGEAFGLAAPLKVFSQIFYADAEFEPGGTLRMTKEHPERAVFVVGGALDVAGAQVASGDMVVLDERDDVTLTAKGPARAMLLGGAPLDGPRHLWWNFVSSSRERIERGKADWRAQTIGRIPGETEFIPLPET